MSVNNELLRNNPGERHLLLGNIAIVRGALEAGVQFMACYPGTPSSEIGDTFARIGKEAGVQFEYSINEKVSVEVGFGACLTGARSLCAMKHLGLGYAGDPISTMPYVGVKGGMVIVSAGDPSMVTSPNEQDQRHYTKFLYFPVFDPATPQDALEMTRYAFEFSEKTNLPVLMRPTTRVCHSSAMVEFGSLPEEKNELAFERDPARYTPIPHNARRMRKELTQRYQHAEKILASSQFFPRTGNGKMGIVAGGVAYAYVTEVLDELGLRDQVTLQKIGAYPIPEEILVEFLGSVDSVLVVEELSPFIEEWISLTAFRNKIQVPIYGKLTDHFPLEFEYSPTIVEDAVRKYLSMEERQPDPFTIPLLPDRPPVLCSGCSHRNSFYLATRVFGRGMTYCNDIGCYTLGYGEPLNACDTLLCMGSSISQASGIARMTGKRTVAYIGDSTFFHSGMPPLANALQANDDITVIILDNYVTAMTGFQPSPTTDCAPCGTEKKSDTPPVLAQRDEFAIQRACRGLGVRDVLTTDPFNEEETIATYKKARSGKGVQVVICQAPCTIHDHKITKAPPPLPFYVDQDLCTECTMCVRVLGCPSILVNDGVYTVEEESCDGCDLCAFVCKPGAIKQRAPLSLTV